MVDDGLIEFGYKSLDPNPGKVYRVIYRPPHSNSQKEKTTQAIPPPTEKGQSPFPKVVAIQQHNTN